jgi:hypothetical protein
MNCREQTGCKNGPGDDDDDDDSNGGPAASAPQNLMKPDRYESILRNLIRATTNPGNDGSQKEAVDLAFQQQQRHLKGMVQKKTNGALGGLQLPLAQG